MSDAPTTDEIDRFEDDTRDLPNVVGVAQAGPKKRPVALVTEKRPSEDLADGDLVENNTHLSKDAHGVLAVGDVTAFERLDRGRDGADSDSDSDEDVESEVSAGAPAAEQENPKHRSPVTGGSQEGPVGKSWSGTGGMLWRVTDPSKGRWSPKVKKGDLVRLSNYHVYVGDPGGSIPFDRSIAQPAGGRFVGSIAGAIPLADGASADVAARTISKHDGWGVDGLPAIFGRSIDMDLGVGDVGKAVIKSGARTGVTTGTILAVGARINVRYGPKSVRVDNCVLTTRMSKPGDSGSPRFYRDGGALVDKIFAGSDQVSVGTEAGTIKRDFGVEPVTQWNRYPGVSPIEYPRVASDPITAPNNRLAVDFDAVLARIRSWGDEKLREIEDFWSSSRGAKQTDSGAVGKGKDGKAKGDKSGPISHDPGVGDVNGEHHLSEYVFETLVEAWLEEQYGEGAITRQYRFPESNRRADLLVEAPLFTHTIEVERSFEPCFKGVGQALVYAGHPEAEGHEEYRPAVLVPEGHVEHPEVDYLRRHCPIVEFPTPDGAGE